MFDDTPTLILGHQKGRSTKEKVLRNFGQPKPEGYRKALRLMELAARAGRPIVCLIDTQGAYPGIDAEERGQAEAIAKNLEIMAGLPVPIVCAVIGEGGSGGALALGVANRILMLEYATYSVISPEGCASILWRDDNRKPDAAAAMKMTATDLQRLGIVDEVIPEAPGGAHRDHDRTAANLGDALAPAPGGAVVAVPGSAPRRPVPQVPPHGGVRRVRRQRGRDRDVSGGEAAWTEEALRLNARYIEEIVIGWGLCPWAAQAWRTGAVTRRVLLDGAANGDGVLAFVDQLVAAPQTAIGLVDLAEADAGRGAPSPPRPNRSGAPTARAGRPTPAFRS